MSGDDRQVHAETHDCSVEVVRYERAGKWWIESGTHRESATVQQAAAYVAYLILLGKGRLNADVPGGQVLRRLVQRHLEAA